MNILVYFLMWYLPHLHHTPNNGVRFNLDFLKEKPVVKERKILFQHRIDYDHPRLLNSDSTEAGWMFYINP